MDPSLLLFLAAMLLVFWLLIIRPNQKRQKAAMELQSSLSVGDEVMLTSGIFGHIAGVGDDRIDLELSPGVRIQVARGAVARVVPDQELEDAENDAEPAADADPEATDAEPTSTDDTDDEGKR